MSEKNLPPVTSDGREVVLEMTQERYDEMKARGIDKEAIPTVGRHIFRHRTRRLDPGAARIKVEVFLEGDVLAHFHRRAAQPAAAPFEAQVNQTLRAAMEQDLAGEDQRLSRVTEKLLNNEAFLNALSDKLKAA